MSATSTEATEPQPGAPSLGRHMARGALWSVLTNLIAAPLNLIVTGYALLKLGAEAYGVWVLIAGVGTYLRVGDFGLSAAFSRLVAERLSKGEEKSLGRSLSGVTNLILLSGAVLCGVAWLLRGPILFSLFRLPLAIAGEAEITYGLTLLATFIALLSPPFSSLLIGAQRTDLDKKAAGAVSILLSISMATVLSAGFGMRGLAWTLLATNLFGLLLYGTLSRKLLPQVGFNPAQGINFSEAWHLLKYGGGFQLTQTAMQIMTQIDRLFIGHYLSAALVGKYDVALKALYAVQGGLSQLAAPLFPASASLSAEGRMEELRRWLARGTRIFAAMAVPVYGLICTGSSPIIRAWLGRPEPQIAGTLSLLAAIQAVNHSCAPGYFMLLGSGRLRPILIAALNSAAIGVLVGWVGVLAFGYPGVVAGHAIAIITLFFQTARAIDKAFDWPLWMQLKTVPVPFMIGAAEGLILCALAPYLSHSRPVVLLLAAGLFLPGIVVLWRTGFVPSEDRASILRIVRRQRPAY
jgi:O-antigen/teichoic acid export membrane protein